MKNLYFTQSATEVINSLQSDQKLGLTDSEAQLRIEKFGKNQLKQKKSISKLEIFIRQLKSIIVLLLTIAAIVSFSLGQRIEGISVILVLIINTLTGYFTELKAIRSMESLKKMGHVITHIIREGIPKSIDAQDIVPGDILILEAGDIITADARILETSRLAVDESILTGESVPVEKQDIELEEKAILSDRINMLFKGTSITQGNVLAIVTHTGMSTELGKIASLTDNAKEEVTPLEERLDSLGRQLVWISLAISIFIVIAGIIRGKDLFIMLETALALAVAAIPEGLPIVATMALAKGMWRMAKKNALINKLSVVETLGATSTIFTDKTGTLTENKMTVEFLKTPQGSLNLSQIEQGQEHNLALKVATLCNSGQLAKTKDQESIGDPMELALLKFTKEFGYHSEDLELSLPKQFEVAFDSVTKMMATIHKENDQYFVAVKGAPEAVLKKISAENNESWLQENEEISSKGFRLLALAYKRVDQIPSEEEVYHDLHFLGLIALVDPAREGIKPALDLCHQAGIRVIMLTGDQAGTASKIAKDVHLTKSGEVQCLRGDEIKEKSLWDNSFKVALQKVDVFSRVSPQQKLDLISFYQELGQIVAMTGDGVNDAPALKKADIGMAMGIRGTQVAKDASDMILKDDHFNTIVEGVKQGRVVFSNIRRFVVYLLSCNLSEVLIVSLASIIDAPLPLTALQILFLNLVTDVFPALALGMGEGDESFLNAPPRDAKEPIITKRKWLMVFFYGILITISVLGIFFLHLFYEKRPLDVAVTTSFLTLGLAQIFHIFNMRLLDSPLFSNDITHNRYIWGAIALCVSLMVGVVYIPALRNVLSLTSLDLNLWLRVLGFSLIPVFIGQAATLFKVGIKN